MASFGCYYTAGQYLTRASYNSGALLQSNIHKGKGLRGGFTNQTSMNALNQASKAAALAAGNYFYFDLFGHWDFEYILTSLRIGLSRTSAISFNYEILLNTTEDYAYPDYATTIGSGTISGAGTSNNITLSLNETLANEWRNRVTVVIWNVASSASNVGINNSTYALGTANQNYYSGNYPLALDTYRAIENRPGVVYDPLKKTSVFAEDQFAVRDSAQAVERELGIYPSQLNTNVKDAVNAQGIEEITDWYTGISTNTGAVSSSSQPQCFATPTQYFFKGVLQFEKTSSTATMVYLNTKLDDFVPLELPMRVLNDDNGTMIDALIFADPGNQRLQLTRIGGSWTVPMQPFSGVEFAIPRQVELWQVPSNQQLQPVLP